MSRETTRARRRPCVLAASLTALLLWAVPAGAQSAPDTEPAFSVASSHAFTTRDAPYIHLTFRQLSSLDFRVYRVNDPLEFFARLRDPHQLGSPDPVVPQERTWLERIAAWKTERRRDLRGFMRRQFSRPYRQTRRARLDKQEVQLRQTLDYNTFAQVPLLNRSQLVSAWREILPPVRDAEARRIPLELPGTGVYVVEAVRDLLKAYTVVIVSDAGLLAKSAPGQIVVFAANRFSGEPLAACDVRVIADRQTVATLTTDASGLAEADLREIQPDTVIAAATCGDAVAVTDPGSWFLQAPGRDLLGYVYTDRPIYRPGHTVHLKGILRWRMPGGVARFDGTEAELSIVDPLDKVLFRERRRVDEFGSVDASFEIPAAAALGSYTVRITSGEAQAFGAFEVQEYRKPEFDVVVSATDRHVLQGGAATVTIAAHYYFGQPVAGAQVRYAVYRMPYYSPLRWVDDPADAETFEWYGYGEQIQEETVTLDDQGRAEVSVPVPVDSGGQDYGYRIEARVTDASNRDVSGSTIVYGTYGRFLLAATTDRFIYAAGADAALRVRAIDYAGAPMADVPVAVALERLEYLPDTYEPRATPVADGSVRTDAEGRASWSVRMPAEPGDYRFVVTAPSDDRIVREEARAWIPGADQLSGMEGSNRFLELIPDRKAYQPGDVARFIIRGEEFESAVLVTKESQDVSEYRVVRTRANAAFEVPILAEDLGDTWVNIAFLKEDRLYRAEARLNVPATSRALDVSLTADRDIARPGEPASVTVRTVDADGQPVRAQVSMAVVDEAVYGVRADSTPDPLRFFYRREYNHVGTQFSREYSFVGFSGNQQLLLTQRRRPLTLADFKGDRPERPPVRKDFPDAIYWVADLVTGDDGSATVQIEYPDSLTTWRVTARAVTPDTRVGTAVAHTLTTKDVIVRVAAPRFLTERDEVAIPTLVHNFLPATQTVALDIAAQGVTPLDEAAPPTLEIESGGEARVDRRFRADQAGTATFQAEARTPAQSDAIQLALPVQPYGLKRETSASGALGTANRTVELTIPEASNPAARSVRIALAPTLAGSLLGALDYLVSYPYGCTEQILSSFVPTLLVQRTMTELQLAPPERLQSLDRMVTDGLRRLYDYQHDDGGWGWWKTDQNHPFMTAYALDGLLTVREQGYGVDDWRISSGAGALVRLYAEYPRAVPDLKAYLAYVLVRTRAAGIDVPIDPAAQPDAGAMIDELWLARDRMSPYGRALLLLALQAAGDAREAELAAALAAEARREGDLVWWETESDPLLQDFADTSVEATALALKGLARRDPDAPLLEQAARWLMLNRTNGLYWASTKQTAMVLHGLVSYMEARNERPAPVGIDVLVNGRPAASHAFTAADWTSPAPALISVPAAAGTNRIELRKQGDAPVYWSATAQYYDAAETLARTGSRELALERRYFRLTPVRQRDRLVYRETPLEGEVQPGDLILVRLTAAGSTDWQYLLLEDPLPAGAEPIPQMDAYPLERPVEGWWESRREYRDDRVAIFQERFDRGRYEYAYLLRAVTPGRFGAMPARLAPMYVSGVSASTGAGLLVVRASGAGDQP